MGKGFQGLQSGSACTLGRSLVQRLRGFEARILVASPTRDDDYAAETGIEYVDLETLLRESDYVSLHAPLTGETRFLIDSERLAMMKDGAFLINTARGGLVNDRALLDALIDGKIAGAGLDTYVSESDPEYATVSQKLIELPNVIATPHAAASTRDGLDRTNMVAAQSVIAVLEGRDPPPQCVVADGRA